MRFRHEVAGLVEELLCFFFITLRILDKNPNIDRKITTKNCLKKKCGIFVEVIEKQTSL